MVSFSFFHPVDRESAHLEHADKRLQLPIGKSFPTCSFGRSQPNAENAEFWSIYIYFKTHTIGWVIRSSPKTWHLQILIGAQWVDDNLKYIW